MLFSGASVATVNKFEIFVSEGYYVIVAAVKPAVWRLEIYRPSQKISL